MTLHGPKSRSEKTARQYRKPVFLLLFCAGVLSGPSASAYTHFIRYLTRTGPFTAVPQKFDLNALPQRTVSFFVSDQTSPSLASNDSWNGLISQLRLAARVWNDVESSELRVRFGGIAAPAAAGAQTTPGIDVVFSDELPPGLLAQAAITQSGEVTVSPNGSFVPIQRSLVLFRRNMASRPSFGEAFFLTAVHELGHALGLQHTLTSSVMSTEITRGTTKSRPLTADDIAGLSLLYPARGFPAASGAISGRVTMAGDGVSLASVVAIPAVGSAVSALTAPDGTYRIDGVPPGQYYVYVHPLPPLQQGEATPANILLPVGPDGRPFTASPAFDTVFFPGARTPGMALDVAAGNTIENVNLQVQRRQNAGLHSVQTFGFVNQVTIKPPVLNRNAGNGLMVAAGNGLVTASGAPVNGLTVSPLGSGVNVVAGSLRNYAPAQGYLQFELAFSPLSAEGSQHLLFATANETYVLPGAFQVAVKAPPSIASLTPTTDPTGARLVTVAGANFDKDTRFLFDGHLGAVRSMDEGAGRALVLPPPAPSGHRAVVVALNADGQSSLFAHGAASPVYVYDSADAGSLTLSPAALPAGSEALVEITANGFQLTDGLARLGFSSSDVTVRRVWVTGPNRLLANVSVGAQVNPGSLAVTLVNGLQMTTQAAALTVQPGNRAALMAQPQLSGPAAPTGTPTGVGIASAPNTYQIAVANLPATATPAQIAVTVNDIPAPVVGVAAGQITIQLPPALPVGPAVVRVRVGNDAAPPVAIAIEPPPPGILSIAQGGSIVDVTRPVGRGDVVTLTVSGLVVDAFTAAVPLNGIVISAGGVDHTAQAVVATAVRGNYEVTFTLGAVPAGVHGITISQDGRTSAAAGLPVR